MMKRQNKGDTLVETVLAMAVLSLVLFVTWGLVNRATQVGLNARRRIEMVNQLKEQAEILKQVYAENENSVDDFFDPSKGFINQAAIGAISANPCTDGQINNPNPIINQAFHYNSSAAYTTAPTSFKTVNSSGGRVWIQYKSGAGYGDFYIRSCWNAVGGFQKEENSQIIVRLNK